jgi:hypothetical protein
MPLSLGKSTVRDHSTIAMPLGSRCQRITRLPHGWRVWLSTADYKHGTFIELHDTGRVVRFVVREDQGDEVIQVRPNDAEIVKASRHSMCISV